MLSDLLNNKVPIYEALNVIMEEGAGVYSKNFINAIIDIKDKMKTNSSLSSALEGLIPDNENKMILVAEESGKIADGMVRIAQSIKQQDVIRKKLTSTLTGPMVMLALSLIVITGYAMKVFPAFESVIPLTSWPQITRTLYSFGISLFSGLWLYIIAFIIFISFSCIMISRNVTGSFRNNLLDHLPPFRYIRLISSASFLSQMSILLSNNIPFHQSIDILNNNVTKWYGDHLTLMSLAMQDGLDYKDVLNTGLLSKRTILTLSVYSRMPIFSDVMDKLASEANSDILGEIEKLTAYLKNFSLLLLGSSVAWIFASLFALIDMVSNNVDMIH